MTQSLTVIKDLKERERIETEFGKNFMVEAGAGAGKTTELINRVVNQLKDTDITIDQIVIITFTKKAANELKERFIDKLRENHEHPKLKHAYENSDKICIGTIHSFCSKLLKEQPFYSGLGFCFTEIDEEEEMKHLSRLWMNYVNDMDNSKNMTALRLTGTAYSSLKETLLACYDNRDVDIVLPSTDFTADDLPALTESMDRTIKETAGVLEPWGPYLNKPFSEWLEDSKIPERNFKESVKLLSKWMEKDGGDTAECIQNMGIFNRNKLKGLKNNTELNEKYNADVEKLAVIHKELKSVYNRIQKIIYNECMNIIKDAMKAYDSYKRDSNLCSFSDLLIKTRDMLRKHPEVRKHFRRKYKVFYVDEFQDTDPIQAEILFYLAGQEPGPGDSGEVNWMDIKPVPGSLFIVGDPKQAIYRFRRADIAVYKTVKSLVQKHGGEVLKLTHNFRSKESLCNAFNEAFSREGYFAADENDVYQAKYGEMSTKKEQDNIRRVYKYVIKNGKKEEIISKDAAFVVNLVRQLLNSKKARPEDIMIITPFAHDNHVYYNALIKEGIPVIHTGKVNINNYVNRNIIKVLKVLQNPNDTINLAAVLHNVFNISLEDMQNHIKKHRKLSIFEELTGEDAATPAGQALKKLNRYYSLRWKIDNPVALTDYIVEDLGLKSVAMSESDAGKTYKEINMLLESQKDISSATVENDLSRHIERLEAVLKKTYRNLLPSGMGEKGVRLMNLHQAKGLQARVVILASPCESYDKAAKMHIERSMEYNNGKTCTSAPKGYFRLVERYIRGSYKELAKISDWDEKFEEEEKYLEEEEKRLLYVAATRAEELLIIAECEGITDSKTGEVKNKGYWYKLIENFSCPELDDSFIDALEEPDGDETGALEADTETGNLDNKEEVSSDIKEFDDFEDIWRRKIDVPSYTAILPSRLEQERVPKAEEEITITFSEDDGDDNDKAEAYELQVESVNKAEDETEKDSDLPYGPVWGTCIHRVFELIVTEFMKNRKYPDENEIEDIIKSAVSEILMTGETSGRNFSLFFNGSLENRENIKESTEIIFAGINSYVKKQVSDFIKSGLAEKIKTAGVIMPEMPFWLKIIPEEDAVYNDGLYAHLTRYLKSKDKPDEDRKPVIVSGVMDLVICADNEWIIVDYKTNRPRNGKTMEEMLKSKYRSQLEAYKLIFERMTKEKVARLFLYSTVTGEVFDV